MFIRVILEGYISKAVFSVQLSFLSFGQISDLPFLFFLSFIYILYNYMLYVIYILYNYMLYIYYIITCFQRFDFGYQAVILFYEFIHSYAHCFSSGIYF